MKFLRGCCKFFHYRQFGTQSKLPDVWRKTNSEFCLVKLILFWSLDEYNYGFWIASGSAASALIASYFIDNRQYKINASTFVNLKPPLRPELPVYKVEEIKKHGKDAQRKWVMFKDVSFINLFVDNIFKSFRVFMMLLNLSKHIPVEIKSFWQLEVQWSHFGQFMRNIKPKKWWKY